ncbi:MAG: hypothetical protein ACE5H9_15005, partial [Anaerolineae bacterium]
DTLSAGTHLITASATDSGGLTASASVSITVEPDIIAITRARFRLKKGEWRVQGTGSLPGKTITIFYQGNQVGDPVPVLVDGTWQFRVSNSPLVPLPGDTVDAVSSGGGTDSAPIEVGN